MPEEHPTCPLRRGRRAQCLKKHPPCPPSKGEKSHLSMAGQECASYSTKHLDRSRTHSTQFTSQLVVARRPVTVLRDLYLADEAIYSARNLPTFRSLTSTDLFRIDHKLFRQTPQTSAPPRFEEAFILPLRRGVGGMFFVTSITPQSCRAGRSRISWRRLCRSRGSRSGRRRARSSSRSPLWRSGSCRGGCIA